MIHPRHSQFIFIQFTRAIRKTASTMLSAALQLIFAHEKALPTKIFTDGFSCKPEICLPKSLREL